MTVRVRVRVRLTVRVRVRVRVRVKVSIIRNKQVLFDVTACVKRFLLRIESIPLTSCRVRV